MFILVSDVRVNVAQIYSYLKHHVGDSTRLFVGANGETIFVEETPEQIDALINEACRRQTGHDAVISKAELEAV